MRQAQATYVGYFWSPNEDEQKVKEVLQNYPTTDFQRYSNHRISPPTYIKTNDFTYPFQEIVNTYGMPMYKEVNPAVFAIISFPFLFGVMFGDMGHGTLMFLFGVLLIILHPFLKGGALDAAFQLRYLFTMMGFYAAYNGLIYNEVFAIPVEFFPSCYTSYSYPMNWTDPYSPWTYHRKFDDCVYDIGVDPRWA